MHHKPCGGGEENLAVTVTAEACGHTALVEIRGTHTHVARIEKDGAVLQSGAPEGGVQKAAPDKALLNVRDILTFAETADLSEIKPLFAAADRMQCGHFP